MSVQSEIDRINGNVASTYTALSEMGATMPETQNSDNLPGTVRTVPQGGGFVENAVLYTEQALTPEQQAQARQNIGASPVNIYTGPNEPTDENIQIWVNPDEEPENVPSKTVQTDWDQLDETAPDFLKNRPFGDKETVIVPFGEAEFAFSEEDGGAVYYVNIDFFPEIDESLKVFWGDELYECGFTSIYGMLGFGNLSPLTGIDTGEPFYGAVMEGAIAMFDLTSAETVTRLFGLSYVKKEKIEPAYIPPVLTKFYVSDSDDQYLYLDAECTQKANKNIVLDKLQRGVVVLSTYDVVVSFATAYQTSDTSITLFAWYGQTIKTYYAEN